MGSCHKKRQPLILIEHNLISPYIKLPRINTIPLLIKTEKQARQK